MITSDIVPSFSVRDRSVALLRYWQDVGAGCSQVCGDIQSWYGNGTAGFLSSRTPQRVAAGQLGDNVAVTLRIGFHELSSGRFTSFGGGDVEILVEDRTFRDGDRVVDSDTSRVVERLGQDVSVPTHHKIRMEPIPGCVAVRPSQVSLHVLAFGDGGVDFRVIGVFEENRGQSNGMAHRTGSLSQVVGGVGHVRLIRLIKIDSVPTTRERQVKLDTA